MSAYYNENDSFAAAWLRELIAAGLVAPGDVDERSIADVKAGDLKGYTQCHFFAGIGGWSYALRLAGWRDDAAVWTGSCPCQPFSAAGKRKGFADDRHLWPVFRELIAERRPTVVFGEQVASAASWLGLVRGDLEALEYTVGAMPIEAASAGADHLRDRFWFVGDYQGERRREGWTEHEVRRGRDASAQGSSLSEQQDLRGTWRGQKGRAAPEPSGAFDVADADIVERWIGDEQPAGQLTQQQQDQGACAVGDSIGSRAGRDSSSARAQAESGGEGCTHRNLGDAPVASDAGAYQWAIGADGKARRVKPGVRLLVNGFPNRVGLLRGFGNAIDPRPAAQFIGAAMDCGIGGLAA